MKEFGSSGEKLIEGIVSMVGCSSNCARCLSAAGGADAFLSGASITSGGLFEVCVDVPWDAKRCCR